MTRSTRSTVRIPLVAALAMLLAVVAAAPAAAHVTANPDQASSEFFKTDFRVGHGCDGSPTTAVRVQIPEEAQNPKAQVVAGWDIETVTEELDEPIESGDEEITERVTEIAWTGGELPDDQIQEFGLNMRIADEATDVIWFPFVQECEEGEHRWIEIPDSIDEWGALDEPAPYVELVDDSEPAADQTADDGDDEALVASVDPAAGGPDALTIGALAAGLLGLILGATAFIRAGRSS